MHWILAHSSHLLQFSISVHKIATASAESSTALSWCTYLPMLASSALSRSSNLKDRSWSCLTLSHADVWGNGGISPGYSIWVLDGSEWSASRPRRFNLEYPLGRRLGWCQRRYGRCGLDKDLLFLAGIELRQSRHKAVAVPTELSGCFASSLVQLKRVVPEWYILLPQFPLCVTRRIKRNHSNDTFAYTMGIGKGHLIVISSWRWAHYESSKNLKYGFSTHTVSTQKSAK
jgi:hypothetical protein